MRKAVVLAAAFAVGFAVSYLLACVVDVVDVLTGEPGE